MMMVMKFLTNILTMTAIDDDKNIEMEKLIGQDFQLVISIFFGITFGIMEIEKENGNADCGTRVSVGHFHFHLF